MKQTQTWSLAGEEAVSYSLARGKAAAVTRESGEIAAYSLARGKAAAVTRESGEIAAYSLAPSREQSLALVHCTWAVLPTEGKHRNRC